MQVFRLTRTEHAKDLSGTGAALFGGRWNKKGTPVVYAGESPEIALLELLVNIPPGLLPSLTLLTLQIPKNSIHVLPADQLPSNWQHYPAPYRLSEIAETWINESKTIALKVPSCIIPSASNYILNCRHPKFSSVKIAGIAPFQLDERLKKILK